MGTVSSAAEGGEKGSCRGGEPGCESRSEAGIAENCFRLFALRTLGDGFGGGGRAGFRPSTAGFWTRKAPSSSPPSSSSFGPLSSPPSDMMVATGGSSCGSTAAIRAALSSSSAAWSTSTGLTGRPDTSSGLECCTMSSSCGWRGCFEEARGAGSSTLDWLRSVGGG